MQSFSVIVKYDYEEWTGLLNVYDGDDWLKHCVMMKVDWTRWMFEGHLVWWCHRGCERLELVLKGKPLLLMMCHVARCGCKNPCIINWNWNMYRLGTIENEGQLASRDASEIWPLNRWHCRYCDEQVSHIVLCGIWFILCFVVRHINYDHRTYSEARHCQVQQDWWRGLLLVCDALQLVTK